MRWLCSRVVLLLTLGSLSACSTRDPDCGCVAQVGSERRSLSCGESACVAGLLQFCEEKAVISTRGACTGTGGSGSGNAQGGGPTNDVPPTPATQRCDELRSYCSSSCSSPANPSADCQATANAGDEDACERWPLTNGVLCHP